MIESGNLSGSGFDRPGIVGPKKRFHEFGVERMPRALRYHAAAKPEAREGQVAHDVERLVPDELVLHSRSGDEPPVADHHGALQRTAERQATGAHGVDVLEEAESSRR